MIRPRLLCGVLAVIATLSVSSREARADVLTYNSLAAFNAATQNQSTITFDGIAPPNGFAAFGNNFVSGGVSFTTPSPNLFVIDEGFSNPTWDWNSGGVLQSNFGGDITATLPAGQQAVGMDLLEWFGADTFTVTLSTGDSFTYTVPAQPAHTFVGFLSTAGDISSITINDPTFDSPTIDNFVIAQAVPEPATLVVFGGVIAVAGLVRRRVRA